MLEGARTAIARLVEVQSDDVVFTSGATESNALAILGHARALRARGAGVLHTLYLPSAHASVIENMKLLMEEGVSIEPLPIRDARIDIDAFAKMVRPETFLVSMDAVCGETGIVWNTREVAEVLKKTFASFTRARALLHVDASQAPLTEKISRAHFGADLLTFDASKVSSARGIGALITHRTIPIVPLYRGGGQERGLRSGSEAPVLTREFARGLAAAVQCREFFHVSAGRERARLIERATRGIPSLHINGGLSQAPNILNFSLPGRDTDYLVALLDEAGFSVSTRSACETDSEEGSRAVFVITGDRERARTTLRVSWGPDVRPRELDSFARALIRAVAFIDNNSRR